MGFSIGLRLTVLHINHITGNHGHKISTLIRKLLCVPISADDSQQESDDSQEEESMLEENSLCTQLNTPTTVTSEFHSNILFYIKWFCGIETGQENFMFIM